MKRAEILAVIEADPQAEFALTRSAWLASRGFGRE